MILKQRADTSEEVGLIDFYICPLVGHLSQYVLSSCPLSYRVTHP